MIKIAELIRCNMKIPSVLMYNFKHFTDVNPIQKAIAPQLIASF